MPLSSIRHVAALAAGSCLLLALPTATQSVEAMEATTQEVIIRAAYKNLEDYARFAAPDFTLDVDDFRHVQGAELASVFWPDLVSPPDGLLVVMEREIRRNENLGVALSTYEPSFRYVDRAMSFDLQRLDGMLASDVLDEIVASDGHHALAQVFGLTSFRVRVSIGEHYRLYRASFAWVPARAKSAEKAAFVVLDHVTQGVEEAALDPFDPLRDARFLKTTRRADRPGKNEFGDPGFEDGCLVTSNTKTVSYVDSDRQGHLSGQHSGSATFEIECSCDAGCNNSCIPAVIGKTCQDTGVPSSACHKMQGVGRVKANTTYLQGASCGAGYICGQKACPFCICGLAVSVDLTTVAGSVTASFTPGNSEWSANLEYTRTCPPCQRSDDDGSGTSGGANGGGSSDGVGEGGWGDGGGSGGTGDGGSGGTGGGGGGGGGGSISVYCDGQYVGEVFSIADAMDACEDIDDGGGGVHEDPPNPCVGDPESCIT